MSWRMIIGGERNLMGTIIAIVIASFSLIMVSCTLFQAYILYSLSIETIACDPLNAHDVNAQSILTYLKDSVKMAIAAISQRYSIPDLLNNSFWVAITIFIHGACGYIIYKNKLIKTKRDYFIIYSWAVSVAFGAVVIIIMQLNNVSIYNNSQKLYGVLLDLVEDSRLSEYSELAVQMHSDSGMLTKIDNDIYGHWFGITKGSQICTSTFDLFAVKMHYECETNDLQSCYMNLVNDRDKLIKLRDYSLGIAFGEIQLN